MRVEEALNAANVPVKPMRLRFAECVLDPGARELRRREKPVALSPRAFQLLTLLLEHRPRPVSQQQLRDTLWPQTHVGYTSLAQVVAEVRRAIGDDTGVDRRIRTVTRFGYAFVALVVEERPRKAGGVFTLVTDESEYLIPEGETLVGRGGECGIRLPSSRVSRVHARLRAEGERVLVEDAGSKNGTWVNRERREGPALLEDGDEVLFGTFRAVFRRAGASGSTRTGRPRSSGGGR
jgi:DNA-binding winged helix-turn-helix (wHTH) protein